MLFHNKHIKNIVKIWSNETVMPLRNDDDKIEKAQLRARKIPRIKNQSYNQWLKDQKLIRFVQRRLRGQLIELLKYLNEL